MILEAVKLKGFLSFIDETVDFRSSHITLIYGPNGEGKSALLESILFCFWGVGRGKTLQEYINDDCQTVNVGVIFVVENVRYKKTRQYGKGGNINELYVDKNNGELEDADWKLITDDTKKKTDEELSHIIGANYDLFSNGYFFGQKETSSFVEGNASDRKELLCDLLDIQIYESAEQVAKNKSKNIELQVQTKSVVLKDKKLLADRKDELQKDHDNTKKQLKITNTNIEKIQTAIEECRNNREKIKIKIVEADKSKERIEELDKQIEKASDRQRQIDEDLEEKTKELESTIDDGIQLVTAYQNVIDNEPELKNKKQSIDEQLKVIAKDKAKIPSVKENLSTQRTAKERIIQTKTEIETTIKSINLKREKIESSGAICPITEESCDKLSNKNKEQMIIGIDKILVQQQKKYDQIIVDLNFTAEKIVEFDGQLEAILKRTERETKLSKSLVEIENDLNEVAKAIEKMPEVKNKYRKFVDKISQSKEKLEKQQELINVELKTLNTERKTVGELSQTDFNAKLDKINNQIKAYNEDLNDLSNQKDDLKEDIGRLKNELEQAKEATNDAKEIESEIVKLQEDSRVYEELAISFGKNGIQKEIIASNVPILEEKTNELLSKFTRDNTFKVKFDLDPITSKGKLKKKGGLDIIICQKNKKPRSLNMYSGGETVRIVFAILLSLSYLLTKRAGKRSQTLIIDERVAALDTEGISQFIEIVKYIARQYKKIFIVSHISELNEAFPNVIAVNKSDDIGSKVSYNFNYTA